MMLMLYLCLALYACRCNFLTPGDVIDACQLTTKNLQVDYLDLYLVHFPFRIRKGVPFPFPDEDKFLYDAKNISQCWKVSPLRFGLWLKYRGVPYYLFDPRLGLVPVLGFFTFVDSYFIMAIS